MIEISENASRRLKGRAHTKASSAPTLSSSAPTLSLYTQRQRDCDDSAVSCTFDQSTLCAVPLTLSLCIEQVTVRECVARDRVRRLLDLCDHLDVESICPAGQRAECTRRRSRRWNFVVVVVVVKVVRVGLPVPARVAVLHRVRTLLGRSRVLVGLQPARLVRPRLLRSRPRLPVCQCESSDVRFLLFPY